MVQKKIYFSDEENNLLNDLESLSPFGQQNAEPIFKIENAKIEILQIFKDKHAKLKVSDNLGFSCEAMFFDISSKELKNYLSNKPAVSYTHLRAHET